MIDALHWDGRGRVVSQALASILADLAAGTTALELLELIGMFRTMIRTHEPSPEGEAPLGDAVALADAGR